MSCRRKLLSAEQTPHGNSLDSRALAGGAGKKAKLQVLEYVLTIENVRLPPSPRVL